MLFQPFTQYSLNIFDVIVTTTNIITDRIYRNHHRCECHYSTSSSSPSTIQVAKNPFPPITYAFPSDRHEVMRVLLTHRTSRDLIKKEFLLHEACKFRAKRCLKLLVEMLPEQVKKQRRRVEHGNGLLILVLVMFIVVDVT